MKDRGIDEEDDVEPRDEKRQGTSKKISRRQNRSKSPRKSQDTHGMSLNRRSNWEISMSRCRSMIETTSQNFCLFGFGV